MPDELRAYLLAGAVLREAKSLLATRVRTGPEPGPEPAWVSQFAGTRRRGASIDDLEASLLRMRRARFFDPGGVAGVWGTSRSLGGVDFSVALAADARLVEVDLRRLVARAVLTAPGPNSVVVARTVFAQLAEPSNRSWAPHLFTALRAAVVGTKGPTSEVLGDADLVVWSWARALGAGTSPGMTRAKAVQSTLQESLGILLNAPADRHAIARAIAALDTLADRGVAQLLAAPSRAFSVSAPLSSLTALQLRALRAATREPVADHVLDLAHLGESTFSERYVADVPAGAGVTWLLFAPVSELASLITF